MRTIFFSVVAVLLGFFLVLVSAITLGSKGIVEAQDGILDFDQEEIVEATSEGELDSQENNEESVVSEDEVDYYLPYPGILPDHPFYFLKMLRDKVKLLFTTNKQVQVELMLLFADKRIGAAEALVDGGKIELGLETAIKAEGYLQRVVETLNELDDESWWEKTYLAAQKHKEVLDQIREKLSGDNLGQWERVFKVNEVIRLDLEETVVGFEDEGTVEQTEGDLSPTPEQNFKPAEISM